MRIAFGRPGAAAAVLVGGAASFVAGVDLARAIRPAILSDPEPSWAIYRFLLWLGVAGGTAAAGVLAASAVLLARRWRPFYAPLEPLPFDKRLLVAIAFAAVLAGGFLRFAALDRFPPSLWIDDVSLIPAALALDGTFADFADSVRPHPFGVTRPFGAVGVLYLELYRLALDLFGVTVFGIRLPFALAGSISLVTGALLGRALLPTGGGTLVAVILAGLRWHLVLSRWSYAMVIVPLVDVATLLLLRARRRDSATSALAAGVTAGLGAHVYLSSWIAAVALAAFAAWPSRERRGIRVRLPALFAAGFLLAASPLFLFREGRTAPYFARTADHNVRLEIARTKSAMPPFAAAADAIVAPWLLADPIARHDLPGRTRLGLLGFPLAVALLRAFLLPREETSGLLLAHAAAAVAANVTGGQADLPNGMRFAYLIGPAAVAIAAGLMSLLRLAPPPRRALAVALVGLAAVSSGVGARDALVTWAEGRAAFDGFAGQDTILGRAAARWDRFGRVALDPALVHHRLTVEGVRRYGLDPWSDSEPGTRNAESAGREFRIVAPGASPREAERLVEKVGDAWGREWGWVYGKRGS